MADIHNETRQIAASQAAAAASLAGGIIAASGRAWSMEEALAVYYDAYHSMFPQVGHGRHDIWKNTFDPKKKYE
ncbi:MULTISPECIES: hypothetical protein [unclassified Mesorhizobium]|uniref:hypothetical protein n=1 Tax=unclassified Mesorhizobium TaxID=325217 RepID=UPI000FCB28B2|nr:MULTISPECIES: hypothetical protein [unclassified Mesorhizobium]RUV10401.1 hypothetical protein EOA91_31555 [Mesorhizobium sp. M1A.F.Ca.IN.022.04.1.1]RWG07434.1 MAG: hypothetical protein EOQ54_04915 [Mesorhizobium sp.]RWG33851.1 MAG: hypothetical protein EOQ60_10575 [Mesorhizobium sp.]RWH03656.1 MAG: hypothetical protein EOQ72_01175 [Mesorhizobium sp.]RWI21841.1 MAG: hypothetical protein EOQ94_18210 [Mesorhizobium sp.]